MLKISKFLIFIFLLYVSWYAEIYGDVPAILYSSIISASFIIIMDMFSQRVIKINLLFNKIIKTILVFGLYALVSGIFVCSSFEHLSKSLITYFAFALVCFDVMYLCKRTNTTRWIWSSFVIVALFCTLQTLFKGVPFKNGDVYVITMGHLNNPNYLARVLLYGCFSILSLGLDFFRRHFAFVLVTMTAIIYALFISGSRKCIISVFVMIVFWLFAYFREEKINHTTVQSVIRNSSFMLAIGIGTMWIIQNISETPSFERLSGLFNMVSNHKSNMRTEMYREAFQLWKDSPIFGIGFKEYELRVSFGGYSHSTYAETLACTGLVGCCLLFIPFFKSYFRIFADRIKEKAAEDIYNMNMILIFLSVIVFMAIGDILYYGALDMLIISLIFLEYDLSRREECKLWFR